MTKDELQAQDFGYTEDKMAVLRRFTADRNLQTLF